MASELEQWVNGQVKRAFPHAQGTPIDPSKFGDPLAQRIDWTPAKLGGQPSRTHRFKVGAERAVFSISFGATLIAFVALTIGSALTVWAAGHREDSRWWMQVLAGLAFFAAGLAVFRLGQPAVFDRRLGHYYRGWKPAAGDASRSVFLSQIHALQIIDEYCSGGDSQSYRSFELNLVLKDGSRRNVIDHADREQIRDSAAQLGRFLGVPVWDAGIA